MRSGGGATGEEAPVKTAFTIMSDVILVLSLVQTAFGQTPTVDYDKGTLRWEILETGAPIDQFIVQCGDRHADYTFPGVTVPFTKSAVPLAKILPESMIGKPAYCIVTSRTRAGQETRSEEIVFVARRLPVPAAPQGLTVK